MGMTNDESINNIIELGAAKELVADLSIKLALAEITISSRSDTCDELTDDLTAMTAERDAAKAGQRGQAIGLDGYRSLSNVECIGGITGCTITEKDGKFYIAGNPTPPPAEGESAEAVVSALHSLCCDSVSASCQEVRVERIALSGVRKIKALTAQVAEQDKLLKKITPYCAWCGRHGKTTEDHNAAHEDALAHANNCGKNPSLATIADLREQVAESNKCLERFGHTRSADGKTWKPPLNKVAGALRKDLFAAERERDEAKNDLSCCTEQYIELVDALRTTGAELATARADVGMLDFIRNHCKIVFFPTGHDHYVEHDLLANKDSWDILRASGPPVATAAMGADHTPLPSRLSCDLLLELIENLFSDPQSGMDYSFVPDDDELHECQLVNSDLRALVEAWAEINSADHTPPVHPDTVRMDKLEEIGALQIDYDDDETLLVNISGPVNDREWNEVGRGDSLREAIDDSMDEAPPASAEGKFVDGGSILFAPGKPPVVTPPSDGDAGTGGEGECNCDLGGDTHRFDCAVFAKKPTPDAGEKSDGSVAELLDETMAEIAEREKPRKSVEERIEATGLEMQTTPGIGGGNLYSLEPGQGWYPTKEQALEPIEALHRGEETSEPQQPTTELGAHGVPNDPGLVIPLGGTWTRAIVKLPFVTADSVIESIEKHAKLRLSATITLRLPGTSDTKYDIPPTKGEAIMLLDKLNTILMSDAVQNFPSDRTLAFQWGNEIGGGPGAYRREHLDAMLKFATHTVRFIRKWAPHVTICGPAITMGQVKYWMNRSDEEAHSQEFIDKAFVIGAALRWTHENADLVDLHLLGRDGSEVAQAVGALRAYIALFKPTRKIPIVSNEVGIPHLPENQHSDRDAVIAAIRSHWAAIVEAGVVSAAWFAFAGKSDMWGSLFTKEGNGRDPFYDTLREIGAGAGGGE